MSSRTCASTSSPTSNQENPPTLLPDSTKEEVVDAIFLINLLTYKQTIAPLPSFNDDPPTATPGQQLLDYINADPDNEELFNETLLKDKILNLHDKYKKLLEKKLENPNQEDLNTDSEKLIFMLSERIWNPEYDISDYPEVKSSEDEGMFLFPKSSCEEDDDIATLVNLNIYGQYDESFLPSFLDQPGQKHSLADFINSNRKNRGCINEARLRDKVLKLQTRYKEIVVEKGMNPSDQDFSTYNEHLIFRLSRRAWANV